MVGHFLEDAAAIYTPSPLPAIQYGGSFTQLISLGLLLELGVLVWKSKGESAGRENPLDVLPKFYPIPLPSLPSLIIVG